MILHVYSGNGSRGMGMVMAFIGVEDGVGTWGAQGGELIQL
jgi:hypothetical protein